MSQDVYLAIGCLASRGRQEFSAWPRVLVVQVDTSSVAGQCSNIPSYTRNRSADPAECPAPLPNVPVCRVLPLRLDHREVC